MSVDDDDDRDGEGGGSNPAPLISVKIEAKLDDALGLGRAAESKGGQAILDQIGGLVGDFRKRIFGREINRIDAERIVLMAAAESKAALIATAYSTVEADLRVRAGERVVRDETRSQLYIETTTLRAAELADHRDAQSSTLDNSSLLSWIDCVKSAHSSEVREYLARILAYEASGNEGAISGPSLALLRDLTTNLVIALNHFLRIRRVYGSFPWHGSIIPCGHTDELRVLVEMGFLSVREYDCWPLLGFKAYLRSQSEYDCRHKTLDFSARGKALERSVFDDTFIDDLIRTMPIRADDAASDVARLLSLNDFVMDGDFVFHAGPTGEDAIRFYYGEPNPSEANPNSKIVSLAEWLDSHFPGLSEDQSLDANQRHVIDAMADQRDLYAQKFSRVRRPRREFL